VEEERCHWAYRWITGGGEVAVDEAGRCALGEGAAKHEELVEVWVTPGGIGMMK
jgi:hypothetical protein